MKSLVSDGCGLGRLVPAILVLCLGVNALGQGAPPDPLITPQIDATLLAQATAKGQAMVSKAKWKMELNIRTMAEVVGPTLVCRGSAPETAGRGAAVTPRYKAFVVDRGTGGVLVETPTMPAMIAPVSSGLPMAWIDDALTSFETKEGLLKLMRWSADRPEGATVWEAAYTPPPGVGGVTARVNPTFDGKQIIAGESWGPLGTDSGRGRPIPPTPLTIRSFDSKTGQLQWATPVPGKVGRAIVAAVAEGKVYVLAPGMILCLNADDGKVLLKKDVDATWLEQVVQGTTLYTLAQNSVVTAYDLQTGNELWHTALSKDCDPAKSKFGEMFFRPALALDGDRLLAATSMYNPNGANRGPGGAEPELGISVLSVKTGKQTGYFDARGLTNKISPFRDLQIHGEVLIAARGDSVGTLGIDRKTLQLQWYIPASSTVTADGVLYVQTITGNNSPVTEIVAVPLDPGQ